MPQETILIVEDDQNIAKLVRYNLEKAGYRVFVTITGEDALEQLSKQLVDLIILDLMLPKMDGLETCRRLKDNSRLSSIPIMILTARGEEVDRVVGFELGADDYVVKPFSPQELVSRVRAVLRRAQGAPVQSTERALEFDSIRIDPVTRLVTMAGVEISLTAKEFDLLWFMANHPRQVFNRATYLNRSGG